MRYLPTQGTSSGTPELLVFKYTGAAVHDWFGLWLGGSLVRGDFMVILVLL